MSANATITRLTQFLLQSSVSTLYTVPANKALVDCAIYFSNTTTTDQTVTCYFVPSAQSPGADYYLLESFNVSAKGGFLMQPKQRIDTGGTIRAFAATNNVVSAHVTGVLVDTSTDSTLITRLYQGQLAAALATLYTAAGNGLVDEAIWLFNFDTAPRNVTLEFIPSGQSSAADYRILSARTIQAKSGIALQLRQRIDTGGTIRAFADTASKVTCAMTGIVI